MKPFVVGMLGCGTVGRGVVHLLRDTERFAAHLDRPIQLKRIYVRKPEKLADLQLPAGLVTTRVEDILQDTELDAIIEVMGGLEPAGAYVRAALESGKHVVTANKALLAEAGAALFAAARAQGRKLLFEASVAGGIPVIGALRDGLVANQIERVAGIINGTSNYILSRMTQEGLDFAEVLQQAQAAGYAEADPSFDIDGIDAAHKLAILIQLCFGVRVPFRDIYVEGIRQVSAVDIQFAARLGYTIKLLALGTRQASKTIEARVHPCMVPQDHLLSQVHGAKNAISLWGDAVGELMLYGAGAGSLPTASAVVSDLVHLVRYGNQVEDRAELHEALVAPASVWKSEYYVRFRVIDRPGVLAQIAGILGQQQLSITSLYQPERAEGSLVDIVIITHAAPEQNLQAALAEIAQRDICAQAPVLIRSF